VLIARPRASQQIVGPVPSVEAPAGGLR
jgi:hypothetical protein